MKKLYPLTLSVLSGLLLAAAWPTSYFTLLIFIAFVPLLLLETACKKRIHFFGYTYLTLLIWNGCTTWWMCNSTVPGGITAMLANSLLMSIPWIGFYNIKKRMGAEKGYIALVLFWLTFEYIHLNWELSWPWLTLGNAFATHPHWVQWYAYTGSSGGSLWILLANVLFFQLLRANFTVAKSARPYSWSVTILLLAPVIISYFLLQNARSEMLAAPNTVHSNVVVIQPNIDPWDEKFEAGKEEAQVQKFIRLSESAIDTNTRLVVWPETAIPVSVNEADMSHNYFLAPVWDFLKRHPHINLLTGIEGFRFFDEQHKDPYSYPIPNSNKYADSYNSAVLFNGDTSQVYHKSKLVPGAEVLPSFIRFLSVWFDKFGGTTGGYARQKERTVLKTYNHSYNIAPAVCYESIYGEFMSVYVRNGADLIAVITNDGWWGDTQGYKQHESYARLRAVETRRWIVRSANTGISCFIDPLGDVIDPQPWNKTAVIRMEVPALKTVNFFVAFGDLISRLAIVLTVAMIAWNLVYIFKKKPLDVE